jgi:hypothetical protein
MTSNRVRITCDCRHHKGKACEIAAGPFADTTQGDSKTAKTLRHNLVNAAHSMLAKTESGRRNGPWAV